MATQPLFLLPSIAVDVRYRYTNELQHTTKAHVVCTVPHAAKCRANYCALLYLLKCSTRAGGSLLVTRRDDATKHEASVSMRQLAATPATDDHRLRVPPSSRVDWLALRKERMGIELRRLLA